MKSVKENALECITTSGDQIEGRPVRRGGFDAVFATGISPAISRKTERAGTLAVGGKVDFIYCATLFDYLSGVRSKTIVNLFFQWRQRSRLALVMNMNDSKLFWPASGGGPWKSSFRTERMGALHG
jgi:hypothetical protein